MSRYFNRNQNRFDNYRELTSKFDSMGACGHAIKKGDVIGWHHIHGARCSDCWRKWCSENAEAAAYEQANNCYEPDFS